MIQMSSPFRRQTSRQSTHRLTAIGYRGSLISTGLVPGGYDTTNLFARIDHQINAKNSFTATYNFYDISAINARTVGGLNAVSRGTNLDNRDHTVNTQNITTIGARVLNEAQFSISAQSSVRARD